MISYTCICMYMQHYMTKQSTYQSIKQLLVSKLMSSHSDTAATATVQRRHLALAFKVLPLMVKEKVSGRVLTTDAELNQKKIWQLMVFRWKVCRDHCKKKKVGPGPMVQYWFSPGKLNPDLLGLGSKPHHLEGELLLVVGDLNWEVHLSNKCGSSWLKTWNTTFRYVHLDTFRYILVHARFLSPQ